MRSMKNNNGVIKEEVLKIWMEDQRVGESGLSGSTPSTHHHANLAYGIIPSATNFFDHEGAAYFGELEEALMHGVSVGPRNSADTKNSFFTTRLSTLDIFPNQAMRSKQTSKDTSQDCEESSDSGSAHNTISQLDWESTTSRKASSEHSAEQQQSGMNASDNVPRTGAAPNHQLRNQDKKRVVGSTSTSAEKDGKTLDAKTLRRLAQNREAARKSRLRKKAYVQQLESSRMKLSQLEQDLQRARSHGLFLAGGSAGGSISSGAAVFDMEYSRWLEEDKKHMTELRRGLQAHLPDSDLRVIIDECLTHCDELFQLKSVATKSDVFHLITGMWASPAERCFQWMGGFRPSELLKILIPQLDPLTEQQLVGICCLQQSSLQAEEALSQGLDQLYQSLADTIACESLTDSAHVGNYMGYMAIALGKLTNLEGFVRQADNLRQQTLHQMRRILTVRQAARCLVAISEYHSRLRALSSLWVSRSPENLIGNQNSSSTTAELQIIHQVPQGHFSPY